MRRDLAIGVVGACAILLAAAGLVDGALRAGPVVAALAPASLQVEARGSWETQGDTRTSGLCLMPPCDPRTAVDLLLIGLPAGAYSAFLAGAADRVPIGVFDESPEGMRLHYEEGVDHGDRSSLIVVLAGQDVAVLELPAGGGPLDGSVAVQWATGPGTVRANEIGGIEVSAVAKATIQAVPPEGWRFHAWFEGARGSVDLGAFSAEDGRSVLDARVERVRLEDQGAFVVRLAAAEDTAPEAGLPILSAAL